MCLNTCCALKAFSLCAHHWGRVIVTRGRLDKSVCLQEGGLLPVEGLCSLRIPQINFAFCFLAHGAAPDDDEDENDIVMIMT